MSQKRPNPSHGRSFSEPLRRKVANEESRHREDRQRYIFRKGSYKSSEILDNPYDSDSERSEVYSEPRSGAASQSFKDSGYNSLRSTPMSSPLRARLLACQSEESVSSSSASSVVGLPIAGADSVRVQDRDAPVLDSVSENEVPASDHVYADAPEVCFSPRSPNPPSESEYQEQCDDTVPNAVNSLYTAASEAKPLDWSRLMIRATQADRKRSGEGKFRRNLHRFWLWRRSAGSTKNPGNETDDAHRTGNKDETATNNKATSSNTVALSSGEFPLESLCPDITKLPEPVLPPASPEECSTCSPSLPSELPSAIAALELEHTNSQPASSLGRTPDSSRTLNTLSEGEVSFMGIENNESMHIRPDEIVDQTAARCLEELAAKIVRRCLQESARSGLRKQGGHQCGSSSSSSSSSSTQSSPNVTPVTSATNTPVRSRFPRKAQDDPGDEDGMKRRRTPKRKHSNGDLAVRLFACPYAKFDPSRYSRENLSEPNYWNCGSCCLRDISRLKQHLYRVHSKPSYYCGSCFQSFKSREDLDQHARQRPPCEISDSRFADRMTDSQFQAIKRRVLRGDPPELWFNIYSILFPGAPKPPSPYVSSADTATINHFVALFMWFGPEEMMSAFSNRHAQSGHPPLDLSTQTVVDEAFEIALPEYLRQRSSSQLSTGPMNIQVERTSQVLEEDVLTMASFTGGHPHQHALPQSQIAPPEHFGQGIEGEREDSTPRAQAMPSESSVEDPFCQNFEVGAFHGWPGMQSGIQAAFDNYMPFNDPDLQPAVWAMHMPEGPTIAD